MVVEKGITVEGKSLKEHFEATNHAAALDFINQLSRKNRQHVTEDDLLTIHRLILHGIDDANAGHYRYVPVRIAGSTTVLPNYAKMPELMADFMAWLQDESPFHEVKIAAEAHYRLVSIHPFVDGNSRTARLLMNLLLMQAGYPPAIIRPEDRRVYLTALEKGQTTGDTADYYQVIYQAVDRSLDIYLAASEGESESSVSRQDRPAAPANDELADGYTTQQARQPSAAS